jgi:hypothetical protein
VVITTRTLHLFAASVLVLEGAIRRVLSGAVLPEATKAALFRLALRGFTRFANVAIAGPPTTPR